MKNLMHEGHTCSERQNNIALNYIMYAQLKTRDNDKIGVFYSLQCHISGTNFIHL